MKPVAWMCHRWFSKNAGRKLRSRGVALQCRCRHPRGYSPCGVLLQEGFRNSGNSETLARDKLHRFLPKYRIAGLCVLLAKFLSYLLLFSVYGVAQNFCWNPSQDSKYRTWCLTDCLGLFGKMATNQIKDSFEIF